MLDTTNNAVKAFLTIAQFHGAEIKFRGDADNRDTFPTAYIEKDSVRLLCFEEDGHYFLAITNHSHWKQGAKFLGCLKAKNLKQIDKVIASRFNLSTLDDAYKNLVWKS